MTRRLSKFKLQATNCERKHARISLRLRLTKQVALSGNVSDIFGTCGFEQQPTKNLLLLSSPVPPRKRLEGTFNETATAFSHVDSNPFIIHYTRHYTVLSYRQHREIKPQIQNVQYRSVGRNIFQPGYSRQEWLGIETQKRLKHVNILKHQLIIFVLHLAIFNKKMRKSVLRNSLFFERLLHPINKTDHLQPFV